ncbi:MAG TPA: GtrA family protein [Treponema sp.]|nr:GtrA family protein [Treponema sp.]
MYELIKFGITGGLGSITNLAIFYVLVDRLSFLPQAVSVLCFVIAGTQNFFINTVWTFKRPSPEKEKVNIHKWILFMSSSLVGLFVNIAVLTLLLHFFSFSLQTIPQLIGILSGMIFNFVLSKQFVFKVK